MTLIKRNCVSLNTENYVDEKAFLSKVSIQYGSVCLSDILQPNVKNPL
jgi:hypothetical protein